MRRRIDHCTTNDFTVIRRLTQALQIRTFARLWTLQLRKPLVSITGLTLDQGTRTIRLAMMIVARMAMSMAVMVVARAADGT
jgi:hypothetical protein